MTDRLIDKIIALSPTERRKLHVPEWDVDLYFEPLTKAQMEEATPKDADAYPDSTQSLFLLVHTAKDAAGKPVFKRTDVEALRQKADLHVITRVEKFMWGTMIPSVADAERDLAKNPTSASA